MLFPLAITNPYYIHLLETIMIYAILLFGLDIVVGYTGQVSLGHAGLFGIGSYTAGVLVMNSRRAAVDHVAGRGARDRRIRRDPGAAGAACLRPGPSRW